MSDWSSVQPPVQTPAPGTRLVRHQGEVLTIELHGAAEGTGHAFVRTNLGRAEVRWREVLAYAEEGRAILHRDWSDVPMRQLGPGHFRVDLPLIETGVFEAKAFLLHDGEETARWVPGENLRLKVESAEAYCANTIYCAFPRQFARQPDVPPETGQAIRQLDALGYHVIPPSGTFRDLIGKLDEIAALRVRILQLLPVHPVPTTFARMGRFGSPFAAGDYATVDPALAEFDTAAPPMSQFRELVDAAHARSLRVFLDMPANHTGWASALQNHHPEWFQRNADGTFVQPGAWGVVWEDLVALDFSHHSLWRYMGEVFLHWCRLGVDGFRCDAGYMVPAGAWQYIVAKVRSEYPDTTFLLEGLGGRVETTDALLGDIGLDWAYSELFQTEGRDAIVHYLHRAWHTSRTRGVLVHFAETHDNNRLAAVSPVHARIRTSLCALLAENGAFGITNGVEWYATEKVDVHGAADLNWGAEPNLREHLRRLHAILETQPAFQPGSELAFAHTGGGSAIALRRRAAKGDSILVLINLDGERAVEVSWQDPEPAPALFDLMSGKRLVIAPSHDHTCRLLLEPGQTLCLTARAKAVAEVELARLPHEPEAILRQRLRNQALAARVASQGYGDIAEADLERDASLLARDPGEFARSIHGKDRYVPMVEWVLGRDERRHVLLPPDHLLLIRADIPFAARLRQSGRSVASCRAFPTESGQWAALLSPPATLRDDAELTVESYRDGITQRVVGPLRFLPELNESKMAIQLGAKQLTGPDFPHTVLANRLGGIAQVRAAWSTIASKYDAFLAANLHPAHPVDRTVAVTRFRGWVVYRDYSSELGSACQTAFGLDDDGSAVWTFEVPTGMGRQIRLRIRLEMARDANEIRLRVRRSGDLHDPLAADQPVRVILRPDLEWRTNHEVTKAYLGPEHAFRAACASRPDGLRFAPDPRHPLHLRVSRGRFTIEPEWHYSLALPVDAERGMDQKTDLFSPGYFAFPLLADEAAVLVCRTGEEPPAPGEEHLPEHQPATLDQVLRRSLDQFIVRRDDSRTIIAGYPWFLDWGRDTLICLRGVIAAGEREVAADILGQFARFEDCGTIPNMIRGHDHSNRETSDAPLWFLVAARDLIRQEPNHLDMDCGGRQLRDVLLSIGRHYLAGTPNGIRVDHDSGLVFSPSHFTWMDTNHPAGSPREGYPVEIQALWHAGLRFLATVDPDGGWGDWAARVAESVATLFARDGIIGLSDCLHAPPGTAAAQARADDAVRPNQLFAVTLDSRLLSPRLADDVVRACAELLTPCGIRSLADRPVRHPLPVVRDGRILNDPHHPYAPLYTGDEDTSRKPAYHNGTVWSWVFPSFCEALVLACGPTALPAARALLGSCQRELARGCLGHIAEVYDGDRPHLPKGCGAQAWASSEVLRVEKYLHTAGFGPGNATKSRRQGHKNDRMGKK